MNIKNCFKYLNTFCLLLLLNSCSSDTTNKGVLEVKACFTSPDIVDANTPIKFDSSCSQNATTYLWKIEGRSGYNELPSPMLLFPGTGGEFTVTLTVSNDNFSDTFSKKIIVRKNPDLVVCDGIEHKGSINEDEVWKAGETHCISGITTLNATVKIEPGVTVKFGKGALLAIGVDKNAAIIAEGTAQNSIKFTSGLSNPKPGDWSGILFKDKATQENKFSYCTFEYGGSNIFSGDSHFAMFELSGGTASVENCTFRNAASFPVEIYDIDSEFTSFTNNTIISPNEYAIKTPAWKLHTIGPNNDIQSKGILVDGSEVRETGTWYYQTCPLYVEGYISIGSNEGNILTIEPGVDIRFLENVDSNGITVSSYSSGGLIAKGTEDKPIKISSGNPVKEMGDWGSIKFNSSALPSILEYVEISYAGSNFNKAVIEIYNDVTSITNTKISKSKGLGIWQEKSFPKFENNFIEVEGEFAIEMPVASVKTLGVNNTFGENNKIKILTNQMSGRITGSHLWRNHNVPYVLFSQLIVGDSNVPDTDFTIEKGTTILVSWGGSITVGNDGFASISAVGTADEPITFSGYPDPEDGKVLEPGFWQGILLNSRIKKGSKLDYCKVSYGGKYGNISVSSGNTITPEKLTISNCTLTNSSRYGLYLYQANPTISNISYSNNAEGDRN